MSLFDAPHQDHDSTSLVENLAVSVNNTDSRRNGSGTVKGDWDWSNGFIPFIQLMVGPNLLGPASFELDTQEATDLVILKARDMRIACRVRDRSYLAKYGGEFTIRSKRDTGATTEFEKIRSGFGDWMFYGFAAECPRRVDQWSLFSLEIFRRELERRPELDWGDIPNWDGTYFKAFRLADFADVPGFLIDDVQLRRRRLSGI